MRIEVCATKFAFDAVTWKLPWNTPRFTRSVKPFGKGSIGIDISPVSFERANPTGNGGDITHEVTGPPVKVGIDG
jgi:hypothetical protein